MKSFLKTEKVTIESLDQELELRQLSRRKQREISEQDEGAFGALICKNCVVGWENEAVEDIEDSLPINAMEEVVSAVLKLTGVDAGKNSESAPSDDSSTD